MDKIDNKNIKLLYLLSKNSRTPISTLSKEINLSNEAVKNRIEKLENNKIVKGYKTNINFKNLGFKEFDLYFKLKNYSQTELNKIIQYLQKSKYTTWIGTTFGKYDLRLSVVVEDSTQVNSFIEEFKINFKNLLIDYIIIEIIEKYKISQEKIYSNLFGIEQVKLQELNKTKKEIKKEQNKERRYLDKTDKKIIQNLTLNPKQTLVEIGKKVDITPEAIKYRLNELKKKEILISNSIILDGNKLNKIWSVFLFKLNSSETKEFKTFLQNQKNISAFVKILGSWDYGVTVFANNVEEIHKTLMSFRNKFPELILDYEMLLLFETFKYPTLPEIIYKD